MVWSRLLPKKPSDFRLLLSSSKFLTSSHPHISSYTFLLRPFSRPFSTNNNNNGDPSRPSVWRISQEDEGKFDSFFPQDTETSLAGVTDSPPAAAKEEEESWVMGDDNGEGGDIFNRIDKDEINTRTGSGIGGSDEWLTASTSEEKQWTFQEEEEEADVFDFGESVEEPIGDDGATLGETVPSVRSAEEEEMLEKEEKELTSILKGSDRAFGDLIAASGITDAMLDSLIALKDFDGIEGLPPLSEIEEMRYKKNTRHSERFEIELQKQEEIAKARVRQVDDKGRAYGTGRRKCSIACVWVQPGDGKFIVNDKQFDVYFPMLDHRAALLRPFSETKTLGLWDVTCTVKGGGVSGQVGAIQLGISRALQNWEPDMRPVLRSGGFLTRDPRVVERKKPGKAKARKSFQWVKR